MNNQHLQYIREELMIATADFSGRAKGQLVAFAENGLACTNRFRRKRRKIQDEVTGKLVTVYGDPVPGVQTRGKGTSIALIEPVQYSTASWRRALATLDTHEHAWLSWCYARDLSFAHQVAITKWAWVEFKAELSTKKVAGKTMERLKSLVWLAAQDVRNELVGLDIYQYQDLAAMIGVGEKNWSETFTDRWEGLRYAFVALDRSALYSVSGARSQQKAANSCQTLAKLD